MLALVVLTVFFISIKAEIPWPPKQFYISQTVDHFSYGTTKAVFQQKVIYEDKFFDGKGPVFFYCGNEGAIESFWNNTGFMFEIAPVFKALIVFGEHRYYGESLPFPDSFVQPYIQFLSIEQALADYAYMISFLKTKFKIPNAPVIAFGGSYGGILAAYMRAQYPHIVDGAIAASAPVLWTAGIGNLHDFFVATTKDYYDADPKCVALIRGAYATILAAMSSMDKWKEISEQMELCEEIKTLNDLNWMLKWTRNAFVMMAMMDYPYESSFMAPLPGNPVNASCDLAIKASGTIASLRDAISIFYPKDPARKCYDYKQQFIECSDITGCGLNNDSLAWDFQACTEIHLYDGSNTTSSDMFPSLPLKQADVEQYCKAKWGVTRSETQLATFFGAHLWPKTSNIVFSNGVRDPWMNGGIIESISDSVIALTIEGGAHHQDLRSSNDKDQQSVKNARQQEVTYIDQWVKVKTYDQLH